MKYVKNAKKFMLLSIVILIAGIVAGFWQGGLNLGIDFTGGSIITMNMAQPFEAEVVEQALRDAGESGFTVLKTSAGDSEEQTYAQLRLRPRASEEEDRVQRETVLQKVQEHYANASIEDVERVGAIASADLIKNAVLSLLIAGALILIYISFRFRFHSALAAVICLLHDVCIMLAVVCIIRMEINSSFIAAVLTIVGYSINNTIVVFDRIRDNQKLMADRSMEEIVDTSTSQTLRRSLFTALTTLLTITTLYILGSDAVRDFALPIIVGLLAGTYSSLFLASPIWCMMDARKERTGASATDSKKKTAKKA